MERRIIVGLGNPGREYENTYHNVGALAVAWLAARFADSAATPDFRPYKNLFSYAVVGTRAFVIPLTFMNESGQAIREALRVLKAKTDDVVVIHDDSDIAVGEFKKALRGRSAGHRGVQSVIDHLKTEEFARIRIGIREKNEQHRRKAGEFVLAPISTKDEKALEGVFEEIFILLSKGS